MSLVTLFNRLAGCLFFLFILIQVQGGNGPFASNNDTLKLATFDVDVTPPPGTRLAYDMEVNTWDLGLRARGIVLLGAGQPIVLCAFDWLHISNGGQDAFRQALADAAGTIPERVAVHVVHQHDTPICDFSSEKLLKEKGLDLMGFNGDFVREVLPRLSGAVKKSLESASPVTHIGLGKAEVHKVASNRRIPGEDGKVKATRWTACNDSALRAEPEGLIDPEVSLISFWKEDKPLAVLSYYATHPQSYYRTGVPNPDFPGVARFMRQMAVPDALQIYFTGAAGDIGAGKYNDGSHENRLILAERLADGMKRAWESTIKEPITAESVDWGVVPVSLPPAKWIRESLSNNNDSIFRAKNNVFKEVWVHRLKQGKQIDIRCLKLGNARILHLSGEPFVAYQLAAKAERPDLFVAVAGYGDCGTGYIGTAKAYKEGGYETGPASGVAPGAEKILLKAMKKLLHRW